MEIPNPFREIIYTDLIFNIKHNRWFILLPLLLLLGYGTAGCVTFNDPEASQEYFSNSIGTIDSHTTVGQTIISRRPLLNGVTIWLSPLPDQSIPPEIIRSQFITVELFNSPQDSSPVFSILVPIPATGKYLPITIQLPVQSNKAEQSYYLNLRSDSSTIQVNGRNEDSYPAGQAYLDGVPINADIAFRLTYRYDFSALLQDILVIARSVWLVFPLLIMLWLPGWLLLDFSGLRQRFDFGEVTATSVGLSLAMIPLVMLWTTFLNFNWTRNSILLVACILVIIFFIRSIYIYKNSHSDEKHAPFHSTEDHLSLRDRIKLFPGTSFLLVLIFLLTLTIRLIMVRDLATPAWVDSVHHALITRMILLQGSYPSSYLPYFNIDPTMYHPGFHSIAAVFTWLTKLNLPQGLMILGQVLNALVVFSVYQLAKTLTQKSLVGLFAAFITGFLTPMPAYYTSWGRFTELTGLIILPAALAVIRLIESERTKKRKSWIILLGAITFAGLFMIHYRVVVFLGLLIVSYLIVDPFNRRIAPYSNRKLIFLFVIIISIVGMVFVFPWLFQMLTNTLIPVLNSSIGTELSFFQDFSWGFLTTALGKQTLVIACLGTLWGLIMREKSTYTLLIWTFLLFLVANFNALHLPGGGLISNLSVEIMLFMPISILGGYFLDQIIVHWNNIIPEHFHRLFVGLCFTLLMFVAFLGARQLVTIINPITILARNADLPAIEWVSENIPENETIVINSFAWGYGNYAGSDGGYWISPLSGRLTLTPPVLYGLGADRNRINRLSQELISISTEVISIRDFMVTNQLRYIYIGAKGGLLSPEKLSTSGLFNILYQQDGVWIFILKP